MGVVFDLDATLIDLGEHVSWREAQGEIIEAYRACGCSEDDLVQCSTKGLFNLMHEMDSRLTAMKSLEDVKRIRKDVNFALIVGRKRGYRRGYVG